jgi:hypothetical protein
MINERSDATTLLAWRNRGGKSVNNAAKKFPLLRECQREEDKFAILPNQLQEQSHYFDAV